VTPLAIVVALVALVALVAVVVVGRSRRSNDGVDSFRRQIDALSPEARRPVIDQMYHGSARQTDADRSEPAKGDAGSETGSQTDEDGADGT
jgi:cytochrome oxidase Cu insertion factor (SCO1/SenC/PrrC family)